MSHLVHSRRGFHRAMQISKSQLFTFMEGKSADRYFYGRLCTTVCKPRGLDYEQVIGNQLPPGSSGGKNVLLAFFEYLRRKGTLVDSFKGKETRSLFFLDKDIDDILRTRVQSTHVIYTEYYHIENYLFRYGDLVNAAAAAASLDRAFLDAGLGDQTNWLDSRAVNWQPWVTLCVFAKTRRIQGQANYAIVSPLNTPPNALTDDVAYRAYLSTFQTASGIDAAKFDRAFKNVSRKVKKLFNQGLYDKVFKGKWYALILAHDIKAIVGSQQYDDKFIQQKILASLPLTLDYNNQWAEYFRARILAVLA